MTSSSVALNINLTELVICGYLIYETFNIIKMSIMSEEKRIGDHQFRMEQLNVEKLKLVVKLKELYENIII